MNRFGKSHFQILFHQSKVNGWWNLSFYITRCYHARYEFLVSRPSSFPTDFAGNFSLLSESQLRACPTYKKYNRKMVVEIGKMFEICVDCGRDLLIDKWTAFLHIVPCHVLLKNNSIRLNYSLCSLDISTMWGNRIAAHNENMNDNTMFLFVTDEQVLLEFCSN